MWWDHLGQDKPAAEDHSHWANWSLAEPRQRALPGRWSWALCIQLCMACADLCALTVSPWAGRVKIYSNGLVFPCLQFILVFSREGHKTAIETALPWWSTLVLCAGREHESGCGWWLVRALMCILITLPPPPLSLSLLLMLSLFFFIFDVMVLYSLFYETWTGYCREWQR